MISQYLAAASVTVVTTNAHITGTFNVTDSLHLVTANGRIDVAATLYHDGARHASTNATMINTNGGISARTNLFSSAPAGTGGSFALTLANTNGALDLAVPVQPPDSTLVLTGATTGAPVDARLPTAFEGAFVLDAPGGGVAQAVVDTTARDPAGHGRARAVTRYEASPRHVAGEVSWGAPGAGARGSVQLSSVGKAVTLHA